MGARYARWVRIIGRRALREFWEKPGHEDAEQPLRAWFAEASKAAVIRFVGTHVRAAATKLMLAAVLVAGGSLSAEGAPVTRPPRAQLSSPHIVWRLDGMQLGGFVQLTGPVTGGVAAFAVEVATGDVLAIDVATGKPRWRTSAPKAASLRKPSARPANADRNLFGMSTGPGTSVSLTLDKDVLSVRWSDSLESRVALADGRILSSVRATKRSYDRHNVPSRWRVTSGAIHEVDGAHRSFSVPAFIAP